MVRQITSKYFKNTVTKKFANFISKLIELRIKQVLSLDCVIKAICNYTNCQINCFKYIDTMETIKPNDLLLFNDNHLEKVRKALGYEDVNKLIQDIDNLDDWIKKQNHFRIKDYDKGYLERLLIYNKGSIERTKQRLDKLCTSINLMPDFLQNYDVKNEFGHLFNVFNICVLPKPTKDNYRLIVIDFTGGDDNEFSIIDLYRYFMLFGHYMLHHDYCLGYEVIADTSKVTMGSMAKLNPVIIHKGFTLFTEAMGQRIKQINLISGSKFFDAILMVCKQGLTAKLKERLVVHPNLESLYEKYPKKDLPKEFGGDERSIKELTDLNFKEYSKDNHIARMKFLESMATDESHRFVAKFNEEYSGTPGSFKTLCVD